MPRLSLYKPEKGSDFKFIDRTINEQFQVGGTDVYIHKYLGTVNPSDTEASPSTPINSSGSLGIQDVLLLENRDRHYDPDVYITRGIYDMVDIDFNLSQFGLFLQNDVINLMFHLKTNFETLGRKIMSGDVIELPHLKDEYGLDDTLMALKRFYVVQDVRRPTRGYSQTWYPHLISAKCVPIVDSQEFKEILDADNGDGSTLRDLLSTYKQNIEINDQIIAQAELDAPRSGYNTTGYYVIPTRESGLVSVADASSESVWGNASIEKMMLDASMVLRSPSRDIYVGYLTGDGIPPNGAPFNYGTEFVQKPTTGEFYLRTDYMPNRLFRYNGSHWVRYEDNVRMTLNNFGSQDVASGTFVGKAIRQSQKFTFINNTSTATINGVVVPERQALSKVLKPKADN